MFSGFFSYTLYQINITYMARIYGRLSISNSTENHCGKISPSIGSKTMNLSSLMITYFCTKRKSINLKNKKSCMKPVMILFLLIPWIFLLGFPDVRVLTSQTKTEGIPRMSLLSEIILR